MEVVFFFEEFDIATTAEFESEVRDMCNLSKALVEQGIEQKNLSLAKMMLEGNEPIDKIVKYTGYDVDKIKEIAKHINIPVSV